MKQTLDRVRVDLTAYADNLVEIKSYRKGMRQLSENSWSQESGADLGVGKSVTRLT